MSKPIPTWPNERDLARYASYSAIDFTKELSDGEIWIDIGCRSGKALSQSTKFYRAKLIGVNAHRIRVRSGILSVFASIPDDVEFYQRYRRKAKLVTDIHGAITYSENPLNTLIYEARLLKPNAKAVSVTLESRMGSVATWKKISQFFKLVMGQKIEFKRFRSYTDNTQTAIKTLRITITGHCRSRLSLKNLFAKACAEVGEMKKTKVIAHAHDNTAQVWQVRYR